MWLCGRHLLPSFECLRLESSCPDNLMCQGGVLSLRSALEVLLDHRHDLVEGEGGGDALGGAADRGRPAPAALGLGLAKFADVEVGEDLREVDVAAGAVLADGRLGVRCAPADAELVVEGDHDGGVAVPDQERGGVTALHHRDHAVGRDADLDLPIFEGADHGVAVGLDALDVVHRLVAGEQPVEHELNALLQRELRVEADGLHDRRRPPGVERADQARPAVADGRERRTTRPLGAPEPVGVAHDPEALGGVREVDALDAGLEHGHRADRVEVGAHREERGAVGRERPGHGRLDRGGCDVATAVLGVDVPEVALGREGGDADLDAEHISQGEDRVVLLLGTSDERGGEGGEHEGGAGRHDDLNAALLGLQRSPLRY